MRPAQRGGDSLFSYLSQPVAVLPNSTSPLASRFLPLPSLTRPSPLDSPLPTGLTPRPLDSPLSSRICRTTPPLSFTRMPPSRLSLLSLLALLATACSPPAHIGGAPSTAPSPSAEWGAQKTTGAGATFDKTETARAERGSAIPVELATRMDRLSIADAVDLALGNSPQ